jgi:hypothetical protein
MKKRDIRILEDKFIEPMMKSELCAYLQQYPLVKYIYKPETNQVITKVDNEAVRGMIATVKHLVAVVE